MWISSLIALFKFIFRNFCCDCERKQETNLPRNNHPEFWQSKIWKSLTYPKRSSPFVKYVVKDKLTRVKWSSLALKKCLFSSSSTNFVPTDHATSSFSRLQLTWKEPKGARVNLNVSPSRENFHKLSCIWQIAAQTIAAKYTDLTGFPIFRRNTIQVLVTRTHKHSTTKIKTNSYPVVHERKQTIQSGWHTICVCSSVSLPFIPRLQPPTSSTPKNLRWTPLTVNEVIPLIRITTIRFSLDLLFRNHHLRPTAYVS